MQLKNLKTNFLGRNIYFYKTIDSTQREIWRRIDKNEIINGTLISSDIQTLGMGTHGKTWYTDEENNIAFSIFIEMNCNIKILNGLTIRIAEIIVDIFKNKYEIELEVKKPNDIYLKGKKLGGILTETRIVSNEVKYLVIGIGINTNKEKFNKEIKEIATSVKKEFGISIDTKEFITEFCNKFEIEINQRRKN